MARNNGGNRNGLNFKWEKQIEKNFSDSDKILGLVLLPEIKIHLKIFIFLA